uniref:Homeobox domain-containing protein n=1 Tax=Caenorhabditis tropicalis TaxID=1561998 RepID=A0A1I7TJ26_9PELO
MDDLMKQLHAVLAVDKIDHNTVVKSVERNPYRRLLQEVLLERKDIIRSRMNLVALYETEEPSSEIEEILAQFENPTFPLEEINTEKEVEWQPLERKYLDGVSKIKEETTMKQTQLEKDLAKSLAHSEEVLKKHRDFRPVDDRDFSNVKQSITKHFEQAKTNLRGDAATKILVLRREIEQQGRKRRNFDKNTTDTLQNWFHDHRTNPYPSDQEKAELAKQCNIKISQVNNWFGNQRIRSKQQAIRMEEEEQKRLAALAAEESEAMQTALAAASTVATSSNLAAASLMTLPLVNPTMHAMVLPGMPQNLLAGTAGFLPQTNYFPTAGQMALADNGNGQPFYTDFENFGLATQPDSEQFNNYLG